MLTTQIEFIDKSVTYERFLDDLATRIVCKQQQLQSHPEELSQNQAFATFGKAQVRKWFKQGLIFPHKSGNRLKYSYAQLLQLKLES